MPGISIEQERQIRELIAQGQKIAAIKRFREMTGTSLKDAKDAVEAIETGAVVNFPAITLTNEPDAMLESRIKRLLVERKKIEAVKVYREAYNCGLKEAKDAVDAIEASMRRETHINLSPTPAIRDDPFAEDTQRNRTFLALLIAVLLLVIGGLAFFFLAGNGF